MSRPPPSLRDRDASASRPESPGRPIAVWIVAAAFGGTLLMKLGGADIWWHARAGQWIAEHHAVPTMDPFSHTSAGPWRYTEALAQLILAGVHAMGGPAALVVFNALLGVLLALMVGRLAEGSSAARALAVGLFGAASHAAMTAKPQVFSYLCFAGLLLIVRRAAASTRSARVLAFVPILFVAWANLHRGGLLGVAVLLATAVAWLFEPRLRRDAPVALAVAAVSTIALTLCSGGTYYLTSALDVASRQSFQTTIAEWQPLGLDLLFEHHLALIPLAALAIAGRVERRAGRLAPRRVDTELLVLLGTGYLAYRSARLVPFLAIAAAPSAARAADALLGWLRARARNRLRPSVLSAAVVAVALGALGLRYTRSVPPAYYGVGVLEARVPVRLAAFLDAHPPPGEMFNTIDHGGYLLYALGPERKVFIDGRNDTVYDDAFFQATLAAATSRETFDALTRAHPVTFAVVPWTGPADPRFAFLHADPRWALVYFDDTGAVLVQRSAATEAYVEERAFHQLSLHDVFARVARLGDGDDDRELASEVLRQVERAPESMSTRYLAAMLARRRGDREAYQRHVDALLRLGAERGIAVGPP